MNDRDISFVGGDGFAVGGDEILRLCEDGRILLRGRLINSDSEITEGLRSFLDATGYGKLRDRADAAEKRAEEWRRDAERLAEAYRDVFDALVKAVRFARSLLGSHVLANIIPDPQTFPQLALRAHDKLKAEGGDAE